MKMWIEILGIAAIGIGIVVAAYYVYPHIKRKQALRIKPGDESATPVPRRNPKLGYGDEFVDISSEPNPFMERTR